MATTKRLKRITRLAAAWTLCLAAVAPALGADLVTVRLHSGREFTARVDARTDEHRLWLRFGDSSTTLLRPIRWDRVVGGRRDGEELTINQLRKMAGTIMLRPVDRRLDSTDVEPTADDQNSSGPNYAQRAQAALDSAAKITSFAMDVFLANWDGDVETDGLVVHIYPLAADGHMIPVGGTLEVVLTAARYRHSNEALHHGGQSTVKVARWTKQIWPEDVGPAGAVVKLPFAALHPEFDTDLSTHGLVHANLAAPGHGVFEQSQDGVRIRPFAPLRDELQRSTGRRFLPGERTGRGKR